VRYFVTVADELHFGRAAVRLHIAQPSLSHQIRRLEQQLGVKLFARSSRHVALTPADEALLIEGRQLLSQAQRAVKIARAASVERLAVGFAGSAASALLPQVLLAFEERQPNVNVSVHEQLLDRIDDLFSGQVDVAFTRLLPGQADVEVEILTREARVVAVPPTHRLANRARVTFGDLGEESFITNPVLPDAGPAPRWLQEQQRHGLPRRVAAEAASIQEILTLVASGRGVCLVPATVARRYPRDDVRYVEVSDADPAAVSLAWMKAPSRPVREAFIEVARQVAHAGARHHGTSRAVAGHVNGPERSGEGSS
jgi:DNA-binding transcriptional LysR family regulator